MAEMTFACPLCQQAITCDEAWTGHEVQCPYCQRTLTAPAKGAAPDNPLVPKVPAGSGPRLSLGGAQAPPLHERNVPIRNLAPPPEKKTKPIVYIAEALITLAVLGVGGYYGYGWYTARQAQKAESAPAQSAQPQADATPAPAPPPPPPPAAPPVWTLEVENAKIPDGPANGTISGTKFVPDSVRVDTVGTAQVLRLYQGAVAAPDRDILIYLQLKAGETLGGQVFEVAKAAKPAGVVQVIKRWKTDQLQAKAFTSGYALKLEFGQQDGGSIPGKIFLALPDPEQTVVAGLFKLEPSGAKAGTAPVSNRKPKK